MPRITRRLEWDSGHRVLGHEGKCKFLHGHRYVAEVTVEAAKLDKMDRVVDFGVVKQVVGGWVDEHWDHRMLLNSADPMVETLLAEKPYIFKQCNPTAEIIAKELFLLSISLLGGYLDVVRVRVYETPNCWAEYPE